MAYKMINRLQLKVLIIIALVTIVSLGFILVSQDNSSVTLGQGEGGSITIGREK